MAAMTESDDVWVTLTLAAHAAHVLPATVTQWTIAGLVPVCCQLRPRRTLYLLAAVMRTEAILRNGPGYARLASKVRDTPPHMLAS